MLLSLVFEICSGRREFRGAGNILGWMQDLQDLYITAE
jgi:hypothetical protein